MCARDAMDITECPTKTAEKEKEKWPGFFSISINHKPNRNNSFQWGMRMPYGDFSFFWPRKNPPFGGGGVGGGGGGGGGGGCNFKTG